MSDHLSEIERMMFADGELTDDDRPGVRDHLAACSGCRAGVQAYRGENALFADVLRAPEPLRAPHWSSLAPALAATVIAILSLRALASHAVPGFGSVGDVAAHRGAALMWRAVFLIAQNGETLMTLLTTACVVSLVVAALVGAWRVAPRLRPFGTAAAAAALLLVPLSARAAKSATGEHVHIAASETVDETLFASAQTVRIEGTVDGDVLAAGETVIVTGDVVGNVNVGADTVEVEGHVRGAVYCFCRQITVRGTVDGNLYLFGETAVIADTGVVERDALTFGKALRVDGKVARDVHHLGATVEVVGTVGRTLSGEVAKLSVREAATIGGDIDVTVPNESAADIDPGATIGGKVDLEISPDEQPHTTGSFYLWKAAGIVGSLLVGLLLLRLFPTLFDRTGRDTARLLRTAGTGFLVAVVAPIVGVLACATVVALPAGLILLVGYAIAIYLAGVLFGGHLGAALLRKEQTGLGTLLLGLTVVSVVSEIPYVGGLVSFAAVLFGLGLLYQAAAPGLRRRA